MFFMEEAIAVVPTSHLLCSGCSNPITLAVSIREGPFDVFCSEGCRNSDQAQAKLAFESKALSCIESIAAKHSCDCNLLRMLTRIAFWLNSSMYSTNSISGLASDQGVTDEMSLEEHTLFFNDDGNTIRSTIQGLSSLESHLAEQGQDWISSVTNAVTDLIEHLPQSCVHLIASLSHDVGHSAVEYLVQVAAKVNTNAYGIVSPIEEGTSNCIGFGLWPAVGLLINHSCYPNCYFSYSCDGKMQYRTLVDVPAGAELTVCYISPFQAYENRQKSLQSQRLFRCKCERCTFFDHAMEAIAMKRVFFCEDQILNHVEASPLTSKSFTFTASSQANFPLSAGEADVMLSSLLCSSCGKGNVHIYFIGIYARVNSQNK